MLMSLLRSLAIGAMIPIVPIFMAVLPGWYWLSVLVVCVCWIVYQLTAPPSG